MWTRPLVLSHHESYYGWCHSPPSPIAFILYLYYLYIVPPLPLWANSNCGIQIIMSMYVWIENGSSFLEEVEMIPFVDWVDSGTLITGRWWQRYHQMSTVIARIWKKKECLGAKLLMCHLVIQQPHTLNVKNRSHLYKLIMKMRLLAISFKREEYFGRLSCLPEY